MSRTTSALIFIFGLLSWTLITSVNTATTLPRYTGASDPSALDVSLYDIPPTDNRSEDNLALMEPIGGPGGGPWDDSININSTAPGITVNYPPHRRISAIRASCGDRPDSLQFFYRDNYNKVGVSSEIMKDGAIHGTVSKNEGQIVYFTLDANEMITNVWVETCQVRHAITKRHRVCFIKIETTKKYGDDAFKCGDSTWRDENGKAFPATWTGGTANTLFAFAGRSGEGIDQLTSWWGSKDAFGLYSS